MAGAIVGSAGAPWLVQAFGGGRHGYAQMSLVVGVICAAAMLCAFFATRNVRLNEWTLAETGLLRQLIDTLRNRSFRALALVYLVQILGIGTMVAAAPYYASHVMRDGEGLVGSMFLVMMGVATLCVPLWNLLALRVGKKRSYYGAIALLVTAMIGLWWLPPIGTMPLYGLMAVIGLGFGAQQVLPFAMLTDVIHADPEVGREGITTGFWVAGEKLGLALGPLLAGLILQICGFRAGLASSMLDQRQHSLAYESRFPWFRSVTDCQCRTTDSVSDRCDPSCRSAGAGAVTEGDLPLLDRISDYVAWYAMRTPDAEALVLGARRICYRELAHEIDANARALLAAGVRLGDRVATLLPPHPDFFVQFLATASIGALWVGLNPRYQHAELAFVLNDCRPVVVFLRPRIGARDYSEDLVALRAAHAATRWVTLGDTGSLEGCTPVTEFLSQGAAVREETLAQARETVGTGDPAVIIYTSGSTGQPKGALLTHRGLGRCCRVQYRHWATQPLRTLNFFPINHIASLGDITCFALVAGGCTVFLEQFDPAACLRLIAAERITLWGGVPTTFLLTLRDPAFPGADLSSVQKIVWSGAAASADLVNTLGELGKWLQAHRMGSPRPWVP